MSKKITTEIRSEEFDVDFSEGENVPEVMKDPSFWIGCCFDFPLSKIKLLEELYHPVPKSSIQREALYPILEQLGYKKRRFVDVLKELHDDGFLIIENGVILTTTIDRVLRNITKLLVLWPYAHKGDGHKKPQGALKHHKLRYYLPSLFGKTTLKSIGRIVKEYSEKYEPVDRKTVLNALEEGEGSVYEKVSTPKGKYTAISFKLKT